MPNQIICPTKLFHPLARPPVRGSGSAVGHDIFCVAGVQGLEEPDKWRMYLSAWEDMEKTGTYRLQPGQSFIFRTGFAQAIDPDYACFLWDRSGYGAGKVVAKLAGVIDADYRGEWFVRMINHSQEIVTFTPILEGRKDAVAIVQGVYQVRTEAECPIVDELPPTARGAGGFGSTDKK